MKPDYYLVKTTWGGIYLTESSPHGKIGNPCYDTIYSEYTLKENEIIQKIPIYDFMFKKMDKE